MPEPIVFAEWMPDRSDRENPAAEAKGVISQAGQYAPMPDIQDYGPAPTIDSSFKLMLHLDGEDASTDAPDDSQNPKTFTAVGNAQIDTAQSVFGGASTLLDGTGDYWTTPDHADLVLGDSDFIFPFRFNCNAAGGSQQRIGGQSDAGTTAAGSSFYIERTAGNVLLLRVSNGSAFVEVTGTTQFTNAVNTGWHSGIAARIGNVLQLYIDTVQEGGDVAFTGTVPDSAATFEVGARGGGGGVAPWTGWLDEVALIVDDDLSDMLASILANPGVPFHFGAGAENTVLGADTFYDDTTAPQIFYGDAARLYNLESRIAVDVSKAGGYAAGSSDTWQFAQFGNNVVAVTSNEPPQHYTMGTSVDFADLAGTPPSAATSVARINDFLMMGEGFTVHWSAFNDVTDWTPDPGTQAGNQELDQERGEIISIVGLDYAAIFQERGVRRAIYVGPPVIWDFGQDYVEKARGCIARNAATPFGRIVFYAADDGFYAFDGQASVPIGAGKVDTYFTRNLNYGFRHKISCGIDYARKLVVWACPMGSSQLPSELLIYNVQDGRWTHDEIDLEFLFDSPAEPFTVDNFSTLFPANDLDGTISPDDIDSAVFDDRRIRLAAFQQTTHQLGLFTGAARTGIVETIEAEFAPGQRAMLTEVWPLGDMQQAAVSASVGYRKALPGESKQYTNPTNMNRAGFCPQRIDARFGSVRLQLAAGAVWRRMEGVHVTASGTGKR